MTHNPSIRSSSRLGDAAHRPRGRYPSGGFTDISGASIQARLLAIGNEYPQSLRGHHIADVRRIAFHLNLALRGARSGSRIADIGGGLSLFSLGAAAIGMRSVLIDDFGDPKNVEVAKQVLLDLHRRYGVEVIRRDVIAEGVDLPRESFDVIASFDSIEHWHHSPKRLLRQLIEALKPGGRIIVGTANPVNLRKRVTVPFGRGKWSMMSDWYEQEVFRGHVREPDVADLHYIGRDIGLQDIKIIGLNWLGYTSRYRFVRALTPLADSALRSFPSLCSDIYLSGTKP